jgi:hypothetical protein
LPPSAPPSTSVRHRSAVKVAAVLPHVALVIAHADASTVQASPDRAAQCHLQTGDVVTIASALRPDCVLIQHYDAAYAVLRYRLAQAVWLQRRLDEQGLHTRALPGSDGTHVSLNEGRLGAHVAP